MKFLFYLICLWFFFSFIINFIEKYSIIFILFAIVFLAWKVYETIYFKGAAFNATKERIQTYIKDCNDLNEHIESLKDASLVVNRTDYGISVYEDKSSWKVARPELKKQKYAPYVYNCSRSVCDSARKAPFKYVCKYFGVHADEETLGKFEAILNNFEAVEEGKVVLKNERKNILESVQSEIPYLIRTLSRSKLERKLGFDAVDFNALYFPQYIFKYISSGGNASTECSVTMDIDNLNRFVLYLSETIKFRQSAAGQRALMTSKLRQTIKERDGFTCKQCGASVAQEPNLLLEIDHIIPVSKGGLTTEENLQTLCWRCNRTKGAKM